MTIVSLLLILVAVLISLALVLGFALGVGWFLTLFLPFTLFEASLLGIIAAVIVGTFWYNFLSSIPDLGLSPYNNDDADIDDYEAIPLSRFYKKQADKTWQAWVRYQIANGIYVEFQDSPRPVARLDQKQLQELAVRLADVTVSSLKAKTPKSKQLRVTMATLKRELTKLGQKPYDDNILRVAVTAINEDLAYHYEDIITIIRAKLWDKQCDLFD